MPTSTATRDVDPDVARIRSLLGNAVKNHDDAAADVLRKQLADAKFAAAVRRAAAEVGPLSPEQIDTAVAILTGGGQ